MLSFAIRENTLMNLDRNEPPLKEPDILDMAARFTQEAADRAINAIRQEAAKIRTDNPSGECWHCGEDIGTERRWCNVSCRDAYEASNEY